MFSLDNVPELTEEAKIDAKILWNQLRIGCTYSTIYLWALVKRWTFAFLVNIGFFNL